MRGNLKSVVKQTGRKRQLRIVSCGCLDVCPSRGTAIVVVSKDAVSRCLVIDDRATIDAALLVALLDERVSDAVSD